MVADKEDADRKLPLMYYLFEYRWVLFFILFISVLRTYPTVCPGRDLVYVSHSNCSGFDNFVPVDHSLSDNITDIFNTNEHGYVFQLGFSPSNERTNAITIEDIEIELPPDVRVKWSERGVDCKSYNQPGVLTSGCSELTASNDDRVQIKIEDIVKGKKYETFNEFYWIVIDIIYRTGDGEKEIDSGYCTGEVKFINLDAFHQLSRYCCWDVCFKDK